MCEWAAIWHIGKKSPSDISTKHNVKLAVLQATFMKFKTELYPCDNSKWYFQNQRTVHAFRLFINGSRTSTHSLFSKLCAPPSQNNVTCLNTHNPQPTCQWTPERSNKYIFHHLLRHDDRIRNKTVQHRDESKTFPKEHWTLKALSILTHSTTSFQSRSSNGMGQIKMRNLSIKICTTWGLKKTRKKSETAIGRLAIIIITSIAIVIIILWVQWPEERGAIRAGGWLFK